MALPRLAALAEVAWSNDNRTDYDDFVDRIVNGLLPIYDERGYNYAPYAFKDIE
jgi:hexosaminidase